MRQVSGSPQMDSALITQPLSSCETANHWLGLGKREAGFHWIEDLDLGKDDPLPLNEPLELHHLAGTHTDE